MEERIGQKRPEMRQSREQKRSDMLFFRSKTQKDSSLMHQMHQKIFQVRVLLKDIQAEAGAYMIPNEIKLEIR